ncbi:hypothetical protein LINPERPRIM_LOCUS8993, partial [Linum perenne]
MEDSCRGETTCRFRVGLESPNHYESRTLQLQLWKTTRLMKMEFGIGDILKLCSFALG